MTTYIYQKDSTLMAFEGPEKPQCIGQWTKDQKILDQQREYYGAMKTARESALPVVNYIDVAILIGDKCYSRTLSPQIEFKTEPVALPGWVLEKEYQARDVNVSGGWIPISETIFKGPMYKVNKTREAYRLVRSESEKKHDPNTVKINVKSEKFKQPLPKKPENSAHGYSEGAECESNGHRFEGTVIEGAERCQICGEGREPSESQEENQSEMLDEILVAYRTWLDDPERDMGDYYKFENQTLGKFTITRKRNLEGEDILHDEIASLRAENERLKELAESRDTELDVQIKTKKSLETEVERLRNISETARKFANENDERLRKRCEDLEAEIEYMKKNRRCSIG